MVVCGLEHAGVPRNQDQERSVTDVGPGSAPTAVTPVCPLTALSRPVRVSVLGEALGLGMRGARSKILSCGTHCALDMPWDVRVAVGKHKLVQIQVGLITPLLLKFVFQSGVQSRREHWPLPEE